MTALLILFLTATSAPPQRSITIADLAKTRLSRLMKASMAEQLRKRFFDVRNTDASADYFVEIMNAANASGKGRTSQIERDATHRNEVTELTAGAVARVRLLRGDTRAVVATYELTGSGDTGMSPATGAHRFDLTPFVAGLFLNRGRSADAARSIGRDVGNRIADEIVSAAATR